MAVVGLLPTSKIIIFYVCITLYVAKIEKASEFPVTTTYVIKSNRFRLYLQ